MQFGTLIMHRMLHTHRTLAHLYRYPCRQQVARRTRIICVDFHRRRRQVNVNVIWCRQKCQARNIKTEIKAREVG